MKIGTIGSGMIVDMFANAVSLCDKIEIDACYSRTMEKAIATKNKYHAKKAYDSLTDLFNDEELDIIYIASPNSLHYPYAKQALEAKKHAILEKPFASNSKEVKDLFRIAEERHVLIFEAITVLSMPNYMELKNHVKDLGNITLVQANYSQYSSKYNALMAGELPNVFNLEYSGGCLMDINIYNLHPTIDLFGKPEHAYYYPRKHANGIDLSGVIILTYKDFIAELSAAKDSKSRCFYMVQGDKNYIEAPKGINTAPELFYNGETINLQDAPNHMYYELTNFTKAFESSDLEYYNKCKQHTIDVYEVVDELKASASIVFKADKGE